MAEDAEKRDPQEQASALPKWFHTIATPDGRDSKLYRQRLAGFVPPGAFDVHAHLLTTRGIAPHGKLQPHDPDERYGIAAYRGALQAWMGDDAPREGLFFGFPSHVAMDIDAENGFVRDQTRAGGSAALMLVRPGDDPATVEARVIADGFRGFKVYHVFTGRSDSFQAPMESFLPHWLWDIAHRRGLAIMLHMVRPEALRDPNNQREIREGCLRYPQARLILAHAGRGFCAQHTIDGIDALRGLDNVYFDTSAVCEPGALIAILRAFGPRRLMFGSDWPVANLRGRCVSLADGFFWLYEHNADYAATSPHNHPTLVGIESLLALRSAAQTQRLTDGDVERVFSLNARELLELANPAATPIGAPLYEEAKRLFPMGTQLLSKKPEMYAPGSWPAYFAEARGCEVIDTEGRRFVDMTTMGVGACLLGYADPDVTAAVTRRVELGSMCTLNPPEEVDLARRLVALHPWAQRVRLARTGGEAMAVAVRLARASTGRDGLAVCGYHGWHDWYLAANLPGDSGADDSLARHLLPGLSPAGVPAGLAGTAHTFAFNDPDALHRLAAAHGATLGAIVMEPTRSVPPTEAFLDAVHTVRERYRIPLVIDEISAGWRFTLGGAHLLYGLEPDVVVFAKALGNGHPIAAVVGRSGVMDWAERSFVSSTYWTESVGPVAALATLDKMRRVDVPAHVRRIGQRVQAGWVEAARRHGLRVKVSGHPQFSTLSFDHPENLALQTLFTRLMLSRGFLAASGFYPSLAHEDRHVDAYLAALDEAFAVVSEAALRGDVMRRIDGQVRQAGFARLT